MPVLLRDKEAIEQWLTGSDADALALQKPAPDDAVKMVAADEKPERTS
jgi:putative SOS response-associated peptidase YedK